MYNDERSSVGMHIDLVSATKVRDPSEDCGNRNKLKVLWLTSSYPRFADDSASIFLRGLAQAITRQGFELHIVSPDDANVDSKFDEPKITHYRFRYFFPKFGQQLAYGAGILPNLRARPYLLLQVPFFVAAAFFKTWRVIRHNKPDLLHAHWLIPQGFIAVALGRFCRIPVIVTAHGGDAFALQGSALSQLKRWTVKHCSAWTSNTRATANTLGKDGKAPVIIPMGIDYPAFNSGNSWLHRAALNFDTLVLLFVGRLIEKKGVADLIRAVHLLPDDLKHKTELWIIGDGTERDSLEALTCRYGLSDRVKFHGRIPNQDLADYYAAADIFIAPSVVDGKGDTEGQGVILVEAMASGTAVISTQTGGISEVITHLETGLLIPPGQPEELKAAIERLMANPDLRQALATAGQSRAQHYDWSIIGERFSALYWQLTGSLQ